jgi:hypothetical protein
MSVYTPDPKIPHDDNSKGFRVIGFMLLIFTAFSLVVVPPNQWKSLYMPIVDTTMFIAGVWCVTYGFFLRSHRTSRASMAERAHDLMVASEDGSDQHDAVA